MPFRLVAIGESPDGRGNNKPHFKALVAGGFAQQRLIVMGDAPDEIHGEVVTLIGYDVVTENAGYRSHFCFRIEKEGL